MRKTVFCVQSLTLLQPYVTMTLPGLSAGALSASADLPEVPAAGSVVLLVVPGVISVLSVPTSLTQNYNTHTYTHQWIHLPKCVLMFYHVYSTLFLLKTIYRTITKYAMLPVVSPCLACSNSDVINITLFPCASWYIIMLKKSNFSCRRPKEWWPVGVDGLVLPVWFLVSTMMYQLGYGGK